MVSPTALPMKPSSPLSRAPSILRLDIARRLIHPTDLTTFLPPEKDSILVPAAFKGHLNLLQRLADQVPLLSPAFDMACGILLSNQFVVAWRCSSGSHPIPHHRDPFTGGVTIKDLWASRVRPV
ncbi:hypothetical protein CH63R_14619 [Colletotrichum higginsianum IMI 349063]|uniref:Uncharacterized protein n=1 Tax=Colletotrichum higginsianum (strain IMI 349063) TaxID=759273 RepID=A0A1B7XQL1_COLHI|nr:hypothetical protein CH63R_14619 [Colletotrichum higginsianum IMI 349063]OBR02047.1 hypothetical protein CH63R_14619 [Colletotrichum higginsianum IMI 349063]